MIKQFTCGNCPHVTIKSRFEIVSCGRTESVIPHQVDYAERRVTFTRVPLDCPRSDEEVIKSETPAPVRNHIRRNLDALKALRGK